MPVNRFRSTSFNPEDIFFQPRTQLEVQPDISKLADLSTQLQQTYDSASNLELPNYLRQSETDVAAFNQFRTDAEGYRTNAEQAFQEGNIQGGQKVFRDYANFLRDSRQPGGKFSELERGVAEYNSALKQLKDTYLEPSSKEYSPELFNLAKKRLDSSIDPFDTRTGISSPILLSDQPRRNAVDYYSDFLDNVEADQVVFGDKLKNVQGMSFKAILESGKKEFIDPTKVAVVLLNATTPEIRQSFEQFGMAQGLEGQGNIINQEALNNNETDILKLFDDNSALGRTLKGLVQSKVFSKYDTSNKVLTDSAALIKKEKELEFNLGTETLQSQVFTKGSGMVPLQVDSEGRVRIKTGEELAQAAGMGMHPSQVGHSKLGKFEFKDISIDDFATSEEGRVNFPALESIVERLPKPPGVSNLEYNKKIIDLYNKKSEKMSQADVTYTMYGDSRRGKASRSNLLGHGSGLGNILNKKIIITERGKEPEMMNVQKLLKKLSVDVKEFKEGFNVHGEARGDNFISPSGELASWVSEDGKKVVNFMVSDISDQDAKRKLPLWSLSEPVREGAVEQSRWSYTGIPQIDTNYGQLQTTANDVYLSDQWNSILLSPTSTEAQMEEAERELEKIEKNPLLDDFIRRETVLMRKDENGDAVPLVEEYLDKNGQARKRQVSLEDIITIIDKSTQNARK